MPRRPPLPPGWNEPYYAPPYVADTSRLQDLIRNAGRDQAEAQYARGSGWGNFFASIAPTILAAQESHRRDKQLKFMEARQESQSRAADALAEHRLAQIETERRAAERKAGQEKAWSEFLTDPMHNPEKPLDRNALMRTAVSIFGPTEAAKAVEGAFGAPPKTREVKIRNADGSETIKLVEERPGQEFTSAAEPTKPETRSLEVQLAEAAIKGDQGLYEKLLKTKRDAERAGRAPDTSRAPQRIETVENGKRVIKFVTPREGDVYAAPTDVAKPASGQQRKALTFFNRAQEAQDITSALEEGETISPARLKYTPDWANLVQSQPNQAYKQAQRAFTEARLRKESGAAVPEKEYENDAKTYFAQPGDSKETLKQKRISRNAVLAGIAFEAGDALREFYGDEADGMVERLKQAGKSQIPGKPGTFNPRESYGYVAGDEMEDPEGNTWLYDGREWKLARKKR